MLSSIRLVILIRCLAAAYAPLAAQQPSATSAIERWLQAYDAALTAKDLRRLGDFYHPDVTIFEGGGINNGWPDYRDHHLGPELAEFADLQFAHRDVKVQLLETGNAADVTSEYSLKARVKDRDIDAAGLETLILARDDGGAWKIRHVHMSSRRRPATKPAGPGL
jgi:ketosteroid isomerase-like protein